MKVRIARLFPLCAALVAAIPTAAVATNGYFLIGFGAKSRGMGGVGVAYPQDGLAAASNPAGMAEIEMDTMRIDAGADLFNPPRSVYHSSDTLGTTSEKSGSNLFLIPNMGGAYKFNRKITVGMAAVGAGLGTRYSQKVPGNPSCVNGNTSGGTDSYFFNFNCNADTTTVGVMLMQMQMLPSVAYKLNNQNALGASLAIGLQSFRAYGLGAFQNLGFAASTRNVSDQGNAWSYGGGIRLGGLHKLDREGMFTVGWNWSSRVYMTKFNKYRNLFAQQGSFDIPMNYAVGFAVRPDKQWTVAADIQQIQYHTIASISNKGPVDPIDLNPRCPGNDNANPLNCNLGGNDGMGFGWKNQTVYKLGVNYDYDSTWSLRGGVNYGKSPIPKDQVLFNMLAPATVEWHLTMGASYRPNRNMEWSFSYVHAFENTITGPTAFSNLAPGQDNAAISMYQNALGASFSYRM
jgi:long-chain fatty acid transport protein